MADTMTQHKEDLTSPNSSARVTKKNASVKHRIVQKHLGSFLQADL